MNLKPIYKCASAICLFFAGLFAGCVSAQNIVSVNPSTGTASAVIPIYNVSSGQISVPVSISYSATGVKTRDVESSAGMNWTLNAGGSISRVVRGLPDDITEDSTAAPLYGWMSSDDSGADAINSFTIQNNGTTCTNGQADITYLNSHMPYKYDTEPDLFYVNAPGLSLEMVYDRATVEFHPVNYQDVTISYTTVLGTGHNQHRIATFTITNDKGWVYVFGAPELVSEQTVVGVTGNPVYFTNKFNQYKNTINYFDSWNLLSITDPDGNAVTMTYETGLTRPGTDSVNIYLAGATTITSQYLDQESVTPNVLVTMTTSNANFTPSLARLDFDFATDGGVSQTGQTMITGISGMGHGWVFNYNAASYEGGYTRAFLTSFADLTNPADQGCTTPVYYQFEYNGLNTSNNTTILPDSASTEVDYWGYYSSAATGSTLQPYVYLSDTATTYPRYLIAASGTPGAGYTFHAGENRRTVSSADIADGSLIQVTYPQGGATVLSYEPNNYYDPTVSANVAGGGIRVKQITDEPAGGGNNIVRNYTYLLPHTTTSSGMPITLPQFAFTIPYSGSGTGQTLWTAASAESDYDLSPDDHTILYAYTTLSQTGAGQTVYNNTTPGTFWQSSAAPSCSGCGAEWHPTLNYAASYNCPPTTGPIANLVYSYPFAPNPNYDFERGLPISITNYNDAGTPVSVTSYTYSRSYATPTPITALRSEDGPTNVAKFYNKYIIYYGTSELTASASTMVYDNLTLSQAQSSSTNYAYTSPNHKLLTETSTTNSDGSTLNTFFTYVKDFTLYAGSNQNINALYQLRLANINSLVETYQQVVRGGSTLTTHAALTLFAPFAYGSNTLYLPAQQFQLVQPNGESGFSQFTANPATSTISKDPAYVGVANFDQYDNTGYPQTVDDNHKRVATSFLDYASNKPTVVFKNAHYNEVAFQDFDSQFAPDVNTFTIGGTGSFAPVGSHAGNAGGLTATTQTVTSGVITKNTSAVNYIFSIWINPSAAGQLNFTGASISPLTFTNLNWQYYEISIPASALGSSFTISFTSTVNISIDDILLYPDVSEAATVTFDPTSFYKICQTNTNGVSAYFANDQWGRVLFAYDQDHNITQRNQFFYQHIFAAGYSPVIKAPSPIYTGIAAIFMVNGPSCYTEGITVTWNYGDGSGNTTSYTHTYTTTGTFPVTVTVTSPAWGTKTGTTSVTVTNLPATTVKYVNNCATTGHDPAVIDKIVFSQGGVMKYSFTTLQLQGSPTITPGAYDIAIYPTGPQYPINPNGWGAILYSGPASPACWGYIAAPGSITIPSSDLTYAPSVTFTIQSPPCTP